MRLKYFVTILNTHNNTILNNHLSNAILKQFV